MLPARLPLWLIPITSVASASLALVLGLMIGDAVVPGTVDWFARGSDGAVIAGTLVILLGFYLSHFRLVHREIRQNRQRKGKN